MTLPKAPVRILLVATLLALGLAATVVLEGRARAGGREAVLEITGFDPRSLLTGHYVRFQFRSDVPKGGDCPPGAHTDLGRQVERWVALAPRAGHHVPIGAAGSRAEALRLSDFVVRGQMNCIPDLDDRRGVLLELGPDRLHVDQRQAEAIERRLGGGGADAPDYAVISVGEDGKARLRGLIVDGERVTLGWW